MKWISILLLFLLSCGSSTEKDSKPVKKSTTPIGKVKERTISKLTFPLDFPLNDLSKIINRSLPEILVEDTLNLKNKGEYIKLKIEPIGDALLASYANNLDASIPMKVSAEVEKKILGIKMHKPIALKVRADMNTQLSIDENWNIDATCRIQKIHWIEPPIVEILGIKVNLQNKVEKKLEEKASDVEQTVCEALQKLVPLKQQVTKIWALIDDSHRVGKKPIDIWLTSKPKSFAANFSRDVKDTLRVIIHTESNLFITPVSGLEYKAQSMPNNTFIPTDIENELDINVDVYLPYEKVNEVLEAKLDGTTFSYEGATVSFTNFKTNTARGKLHLTFEIVGDIEASIDAYASPTLGEDKSLIVDGIEYDITSESSLVNLAEWMASDQIEAFLKEHAKIPLSHVLDSLDSKIVAALNKSNIGGKVGLEMDFTKLASDTLIFTNDGLQWFFDVEGKAHAYLTEQLVK